MTEEKKEEFICPICGHNKYEEKRENNGIRGSGFRSWVVSYECEGCSAVFKDLKKFSKKH